MACFTPCSSFVNFEQVNDSWANFVLGASTYLLKLAQGRPYWSGSTSNVLRFLRLNLKLYMFAVLGLTLFETI